MKNVGKIYKYDKLLNVSAWPFSVNKQRKAGEFYYMNVSRST